MKKKIIVKPWGSEELIEFNKKYMVKKLIMKKGHQCSLQFHKKKIETIYVLEGRLKIFFGKHAKKLKSKIFQKGDAITLIPKIVHRMRAVKKSVYLEASTPEMKDVVRIQDDYKRI